MRHELVAWCGALAVSLIGTVGFGTAEAQAGTAAAPGHRDPAGVKGLSPYTEQLAKGRKAISDQDLDGALAAFRQAIAIDESAMAAYLLLAQTQLAKGDRAGATQTLQDSRQRAGTEAHQSRLLMLDAEVTERNAEDKVEGPETEPEATFKPPRDAWGGYTAFVAGHAKALDYRATATERTQQIDARIKREKDYAIVRQRVADNAKTRAKAAP